MDGSDKNDGDGSGDDDPLWARVRRTVTPLRGREDTAARPEKDRAEPRPCREIGSFVPPVGTVRDHNASKSRDLDKNTDRRLRNGLMGIEARFDLHGMTQDEAYRALSDFLIRAQDRGLRHVLVITGKGGRGKPADEAGSRSLPGVLKRRVPGWLDTPPLRDLVLKYYAARPRDGGEGALYILLRRKR